MKTFKLFTLYLREASHENPMYVLATQCVSSPITPGLFLSFQVNNTWSPMSALNIGRAGACAIPVARAFNSMSKEVGDPVRLNEDDDASTSS